jgi:UDP-N-acetylmuramoyl-L-alanyl-D-glutamate--2,6-diaminopimelate ligase
VTVRLSELLAAARGETGRLVVPDGADPDPEISGVVADSRLVVPGSLFCCMPGAHVDGHDFAAASVAAGASALLVERQLALPVPQLVSPSARPIVGHLAAAVHGHPVDHLLVIGVTGTNGKTTVSALIAAVLSAAGRAVGVIGTLSGRHTTPEAPDLQARLAELVASGHDTVVMEVSSHALAMSRVTGCLFDLAIFTNLGRDHLDLHETVERYFAAKALLFTPELSRRAIVNRDDLHGRLLSDAAQIPTETFGLADVDDLVLRPSGHRYRWNGVTIEVGLAGRFNASNSLAAVVACASLGVQPEQIRDALAAAPAVPGRMEAVDAGQPFTVLVDYAHTPDGLREVLTAVRVGSGDGRVVVVVGCGGDRDRDKRPEMGRVAAELADVVVITSDNPRTEDPAEIAASMRSGVPQQYLAHLVTELDRRHAIALALDAARPGDVVVIAGKGHETTQSIGDRVEPFDDRVVARELLEAHR